MGWGGGSTLTPAGASVQEPPLAQPSLGSPIPRAPHPVSVQTDTCSGVAMGTSGRVSVAHTAVCGHTEGMHACVCAHLHVFTRTGHCWRCPHSGVRGPPCRCAHAQQGHVHRRVCVLAPESGSCPTPHTVHSAPGARTCLGAPGSLSICHLCVHVCAHTYSGTPVCVHGRGSHGSPRRPRLSPATDANRDLPGGQLVGCRAGSGSGLGHGSSGLGLGP
uniref:Uncharacterized protein n=1 Tax=Nomascus leucogenys TaxID=61853 RepID=G1RB75_NOMLE